MLAPYCHAHKLEYQYTQGLWVMHHFGAATGEERAKLAFEEAGCHLSTRTQEGIALDWTVAYFVNYGL